MAMESAGFQNNQAFNQSSSSIKFCDHCETMTTQFKRLNITKNRIEEVNRQLIEHQHKMEEEIATLKKKLLLSEKELKAVKEAPFTPLIKTEKRQSSLLREDWSRGEAEDHKPIPIELLQSKATTFLSSKFSPEIVQHIQHLARQDRMHFQEFLFSELIKISQREGSIPGLTISWKTLYKLEKDSVSCPKIKPTCIQIPLERLTCTCQLIYSIPQANIDMGKFLPFFLNFKGKQVEITESLLLDYGHIQQIIFHKPEETDRLGRRFASCVLNSMAHQGTSVEAVVESKFPEWTSTGQLIPAGHNIHLNSRQKKIYHVENEEPWICEANSIRKQIRHCTAYMIAGGFNYEDLYNYGKASLICEDQFQKIRSSDPIPEIALHLDTGYSHLVKHYIDQADQKRAGDDQEEPAPEEPYDDEDYDFDDEAIHNINNMMEG